MKWSLVSNCIFNLIKKVFHKKIKVPEKGLGFSPVPSFINEVDLRCDVNGVLGTKT